MTLHPLEETFARLSASHPEYSHWLLTQTDAREGWLSATDLVAEGSSSLFYLLNLASSRYKANDLRPAATLWFGHVVYGVAGASIACFMVEQRVPDLSATHLRFLFGADGEMEHIAWIGRFFAASSSDSAAAHPDCIVLPERDALREYLRGQLIALFAPLIVLLSTYAAISQASLWALAADYLAYAFAAVGSLMGNSVLGIEESRAFAAVKSPLSTKRGFVAVEHLGQVEYLLERTSCCRYYQVKNGAYCHSCPGRPMKERIALVKQNMERYITGTT